jgi:ribonuclease P protein component
MLPKSKRLSTKAFTEIIEKGQSFHGPFLIVRVTASDTQSSFAVSVPKKVAKLAVDRNKLRRQIYSVISTLEDKIVKQGKVVIIAKAGLEKLLFGEFGDEINQIFVKTGLLK